MTKRLLACATPLVLLVQAVTAEPAGGQQYPPAENAVLVSDVTVVPGQSVSVAAQVFDAGAEVTLTFYSTPQVLGTSMASTDGVVRTDVTIPADASVGEHTLVASGPSPDGPLEVATTINVMGSAEEARTGSADLVRTGDGRTGLLVRVGLGALTVGGMFLVLARKRRATAADPAPM